MNKIKYIKVDFWNHQELTQKVINIVYSSLWKKEQEFDGLNCVPTIRKPYFWEIWKWASYKKECERILKDVKYHMERLYWKQKYLENYENKKNWYKNDQGSNQNG